MISDDGAKLAKVLKELRELKNRFYLVNQSVDNLPEPPKGYLTVDVDFEISKWIEEQPLYMWKHGDVPAYAANKDRYTISEELYTWLTVRWT
jgi:hypothetical protein